MDFNRDTNPTAEVACRRASERYRLLYANEAFVEFAAPDRKPWRLEVLGISSDGLCFALQDGQPSLERGSRLNGVVVQIASATIDGSLTIDGEPVLGGTDINELDYAFAASIYPQS